MPPASTLRSLFTSCIFTTLVFSTVESYTCTQCPQGTCEVSNRTTCETSQGCFNNKQQLNLPGQSQASQEKGCSAIACTSLAFSGTLGTGRTFVYEHQCCQDQQCNQGDITLPQQSTEPNGIVCPACYSEDGRFCNPQNLKCTGNETRCVEVIGIGFVGGISAVLLTGMGCATETACNLRNMSVMANIDIQTHCVDPTSGSPPLAPFISSTLTGLLLLKLLL